MEKVSEILRQHYRAKFDEHGPCSEGVDWGPDFKKLALRYDKMLGVIDLTKYPNPSLLDVGCGYAGLYKYAQEKGFELSYAGIDVAENMIAWVREAYPQVEVYTGDILDMQFDRSFDYVVCNGILTQKLDVPGLEMDAFAARLIRRIYQLCRVGAAFNIMSTKVNFYANNLYYRNPAELLAWCVAELTPHVRLDHSYPLYEFTTYLYRDAQ